ASALRRSLAPRGGDGRLSRSGAACLRNSVDCSPGRMAKPAARSDGTMYRDICVMGPGFEPAVTGTVGPITLEVGAKPEAAKDGLIDGGIGGQKMIGSFFCPGPAFRVPPIVSVPIAFVPASTAATF